jgi:DNA helicase HerA-like ATPase
MLKITLPYAGIPRRITKTWGRFLFIGIPLSQFASSVEKEIVENSSTYLIGRTETNELCTPSYGVLSDEVKAKLTMLPQGQLLVKFAKFPQPIFVKFPLPPCLPGDRYVKETPEGEE